MDSVDAINRHLDALGKGVAALTSSINHLGAHQAVLEVAIVHLLSPLLVQLGPEAALKLVAEVRTLRVTFSGAGEHDPIILLAEEYAERLADQIEQKVRKKVGAER